MFYEYNILPMPTHIRVTDELHEWLQQNRPRDGAFEDVIRKEVDDLGDRNSPVKEA